MPSIGVTVRLDKSPKQLIQKAVKRTVDLSVMELRGNLQRNSPVDHGKMQGSWLIAGQFAGELNQKIISSALYTKFVNDGTGLYGPRGQLIRPKTARKLAFVYKGKKIAVPYVRGIKPRKFVEKSIRETERRVPEFTIRAVMETSGG
ncbi:phage-related protein [Methanobacterium formicicum]|uniref:Phage-related protein n=1 Tax=Methanobacterium formicicum TaxID=2162 RepID=A0A089ZH09_METFO|nr:HK97 gp10 family phage protein [Methanobacterium formicicum]AIS32485.1 phage-related protein [Methanobacterium formicicum]